MYLRGRSPISIGSNYYVLDSGRSVPTRVQESRAAVLIHAMARYRQRLDEEAIEPVMIAEGAVPLDMWQSKRMFGTVRAPGREIDEIKHYGADPSACRHVVVLYRGHFYTLPIYRTDGSLRGPDDLEDALSAIRRDAASCALSCEAEGALPALTTLPRTRWAEARENYFSEGVNRRSLHAIESALLFVTLADDGYDDVDWTHRGKRLLAGLRSSTDIWFDKSISMVVMPDGELTRGCCRRNCTIICPIPSHVHHLVLPSSSSYTSHPHLLCLHQPVGCRSCGPVRGAQLGGRPHGGPHVGDVPAPV